MDRSNAKVTRWNVTWIYPGKVSDPVPFQTPCALAEGETDNFESIRKMIAIRRSLDASNIEILAVVRIADDSDALTLNPVRCAVCGAGFPSIPASMGHPHFES